jgi:UPF0271 protein
MKMIDLNCDLGEHESADHRTQIMPCLQSVNIACGGHAGDDESMKHCIGLALEHTVKIGAHPGLLRDFGRGNQVPTVDEFKKLLDQQVHRILKHCDDSGAALHHIKLHGSLYHATDQNPLLAQCYANWIKENAPKLTVFARSGGPCARHLADQGIHVWHECFLDRNYEADSQLTPREAAQAIIDEPDAILARLKHHAQTGEIISRSQKKLQLACDTWCLHGDTPQSLILARAVQAWRMMNCD